MERQARLARAEVALAAARRRLGDSLANLSRAAAARGEGVELPPLAAVVLQLAADRIVAGSTVDDDIGTLRARIVAVVEAAPDEVFTPARLALVIRNSNRDSIRVGGHVDPQISDAISP